jgi:hypothetical protein
LKNRSVSSRGVLIHSILIGEVNNMRIFVIQAIITFF